MLKAKYFRIRSWIRNVFYCYLIGRSTSMQWKWWYLFLCISILLCLCYIYIKYVTLIFQCCVVSVVCL